MNDVPEPLTPPGCDLRGLPFMPLDVVRLLDSDLFALSSGDEFKAAVALWCKSWTQVPAASLPDDDRILAFLSGAGPRWKKVKEVALRGWIKCADGRLYHPTVAEKAVEAGERRSGWTEEKENRESRQQRWRHRLKVLSERLRQAGVSVPKGAKLDHLQDLCRRNGVDDNVDAEPSTRASTVDDGEIGKTGTGTGTGTLFPLPDGNGADGSKSDPLPDPEKVMFDGAVALLRAAGKSEGTARSVAGKWKRDYGPEAVILAMSAAKREGAIEPVSFVEAALRRRAKDGRGGGLSPIAMPC